MPGNRSLDPSCSFMELQDKNGTSDADEPPGSSSQPAGWGFVPTSVAAANVFDGSVLSVLSFRSAASVSFVSGGVP
ncbi:hypothetical protein Tco_1275371 [Tanacetum coccineum]